MTVLSETNESGSSGGEINDSSPQKTERRVGRPGGGIGVGFPEEQLVSSGERDDAERRAEVGVDEAVVLLGLVALVAASLASAT